MEVIDAIYGRRSVRAYADKPLERAVIQDLLRAATWAPSTQNVQPWAFLVVQGRDHLASLSDRAKKHLIEHYGDHLAMGRYRTLMSDPEFEIFYGAPTLIVICAKPEPLMPIAQCFLAVQNLMLAAHATGLGTCCIGWAEPLICLPEVKAELGIPAEMTPAIPVVVGWPAESPEPPPRRAPEIVGWL